MLSLGYVAFVGLAVTMQSTRASDPLLLDVRNVSNNRFQHANNFTFGSRQQDDEHIHTGLFFFRGFPETKDQLMLKAFLPNVNITQTRVFEKNGAPGWTVNYIFPDSSLSFEYDTGVDRTFTFVLDLYGKRYTSSRTTLTSSTTSTPPTITCPTPTGGTRRRPSTTRRRPSTTRPRSSTTRSRPSTTRPRPSTTTHNTEKPKSSGCWGGMDIFGMCAW